jgi:simple sugar transport system permease protein
MSYFDETNTGASSAGFPDTFLLMDLLALHQLYADCAADPACDKYHPDVEGEYEVLIVQLNDDPAILSELYQRLAWAGCPPYYLFQGRPTAGNQPYAIPILSDIPVIGEIFFQQNILVYIAYLMVLIAWFVLGKTTLGLKIRAVGENPEAADTLGVSVSGVRYFTEIFGGVMSGIAGASLSIALLNVFQQNLTSGLGFIAVALVYFGGWRPLGVLVGSLIFSMVNALQLWVQVLNIPIPSDIAVMMPYVLTIVALIVAVQRVRPPSALTKPYERGG